MRWLATAQYVIPLNDIREHKEQSRECWCQTFMDGDIVVHQSGDGREDFETGKRKPS